MSERPASANALVTPGVALGAGESFRHSYRTIGASRSPADAALLASGDWLRGRCRLSEVSSPLAKGPAPVTPRQHRLRYHGCHVVGLSRPSEVPRWPTRLGSLPIRKNVRSVCRQLSEPPIGSRRMTRHVRESSYSRTWRSVNVVPHRPGSFSSASASVPAAPARLRPRTTATAPRGLWRAEEEDVGTDVPARAPAPRPVRFSQSRSCEAAPDACARPRRHPSGRTPGG